MILVCDSHSYRYEVESLCRMFLKGRNLEISFEGIIPQGDYIYTKIKEDTITAIINLDGVHLEKEEKSHIEQDMVLAKMLFLMLGNITGEKPKWGMLTGVRPAKVAFSLLDNGKSYDEMREELSKKWLVSDDKISLLEKVTENEREIRLKNTPNSFSLYISIPFCPTRCSYCSFVSHSIEKTAGLVKDYVKLLCEELIYTAKIVKEKGLFLRTVYMGGGTPTTLAPEDLDIIFSTLYSHYDMENIMEFTVEAGRPDTVTKEKFAVLKKWGVNRISINPQTLSDNVLNAIGRRHSVKDFFDAFALARECGFDNINTDIIAGLPTDTFEGFRKTVEGIISLAPENITLHTLTVKRGADISSEITTHLSNRAVSEMLSFAYGEFEKAGYAPYYLYRQKGTVDNLENTGFCKKGKECLYNVYIMDETHTIIAVGAGGVTKLRDPFTSHIERIPNFKYPYEYNKRFPLICERKEEIRSFYGLFPTDKGT